MLRRRLLGVLAFFLLLAACGDPAPVTDAAADLDGAFADAGNPVDATVVVADAAPVQPLPDGGYPDCNPLSQTGCNAGFKCAHWESPAGSLLTTCVPDGNRATHQSCSVNEQGYDDCVAGNHCAGGGVCQSICSGATCPDGLCQLYNGVFDGDYGGCAPICDPVGSPGVGDTTCPGDYDGCTLNAGRAAAICASIPLAAETQTQDEDCYGPSTGGCYLNGCASGYSPYLNDVVDGGSNCAAFCRPVDTFIGSAATPAGAPGEDCSASRVGGAVQAATHQCRFIQMFYADTAQVPDSIGFCVPTNVPDWGDCTEFDWEGMVQTWNGAIANGQDPNAAIDQYCIDGTGELLPRCLGYYRGCVSEAEVESRLQMP